MKIIGARIGLIGGSIFFSCREHSFPQLNTYLNEHKLLYDSQYGFRAGHSTELASIELIDRITQDLDKGKISISIFLDLSKAFDTLDHVILLQKLNYYGIKSVELKLFQDYLQNRTQYVSYDQTNFDMYRISTGVPQGSILGPLLFIIYRLLMIYATPVNCLR